MSLLLSFIPVKVSIYTCTFSLDVIWMFCHASLSILDENDVEVDNQPNKPFYLKDHERKQLLEKGRYVLYVNVHHIMRNSGKEKPF